MLDALRSAVLLLRHSILLGALAALAASPAPVHAQSSTTASFDTLRLIAPAAPGGGWDQTARVMQDVVQRAGIARTATVENIPGAAGLIGLARFIGAEHGNGNAAMVSGLIMLGAIVAQQSPVSFRDVVPIARLTGEYEAIAVPASSPFHSLADVIRAFRERPESISWGGGSAGGSDQILAGLIAQAVGVAPRRVNYIAFSGGGESLSAILGGQVSVGINGLAEFAPQTGAGTLRLLAVSSADRLPGLDVPTLREQGVDVEFENWRSVVAPPGITAAQRERLERAVERMVRSSQWQEALARYRWIDRYLAGEAFSSFASAEEARVQAILRELGTGDDNARESVGPYPLFVLSGLVIFAAGPLARAVLHRGRQRRRQLHDTSTAHDAPGSVGARAPILLIAIGLVANVVLAETAGFVVASAALFWFTARAFDRTHPIRHAVHALAVSLGAYLLFSRMLDLSLPAGMLAGWF